MLALAIVGPIASGKSVALRVVAELGAATCSADTAAAELTAVGEPALAEIWAAFGEGYRRPDGSLDRPALGRLIFRDREARERLEAILHPPILRRLAAWLEALRAGADPPAVAAVEVLRLPDPLDARRPFDVVWLCTAPPEARRARLQARDGLSDEEAARRIAVQETQAIEACQPHLVLDSSGGEEEFRARVTAAFRALPGTR